MIKTQIGMGVLSIPSVFDTLGMIPGVICLCAVGVITTWSDYIVGVFKMNHREVYGIDDVGRMLFGPIGREVLAVAFCLCEPEPFVCLLWTVLIWHLLQTSRLFPARPCWPSLFPSIRFRNT
jgi:hypothetical protein